MWTLDLNENVATVELRSGFTKSVRINFVRSIDFGVMSLDVVCTEDKKWFVK